MQLCWVFFLVGDPGSGVISPARAAAFGQRRIRRWRVDNHVFPCLSSCVGHFGDHLLGFLACVQPERGATFRRKCVEAKKKRADPISGIGPLLGEGRP